MRSRLSGLVEMLFGGLLICLPGIMIAGPFALITLVGIVFFGSGLRSFQMALARESINELKEAMDRLEQIILVSRSGMAPPRPSPEKPGHGA